MHVPFDDILLKHFICIFVSTDVYSELTHLSEVQTFPVHAQSFEHFTISGVPYLAMARSPDECVDDIIYKWNSTLREFVEQG